MLNDWKQKRNEKKNFRDWSQPASLKLNLYVFFLLLFLHNIFFFAIHNVWLDHSSRLFVILFSVGNHCSMKRFFFEERVSYRCTENNVSKWNLILKYIEGFFCLRLFVHIMLRLLKSSTKLLFLGKFWHISVGRHEHFGGIGMSLIRL